MTNSEDPNQTVPWRADSSVSSLFCQSYLSLYLDFYGIQYFKIMHNILREKYFDIVSEG